MAYQALYRSYRPQDFKSVAGQRHVVTTLQNAIKLNKVAHAYLFSGPRGTGKTSMAKIMAKALNCVHGPTTEPCNECEICKGITKGTISDIVEIDAASNNGVDEIRDLRDKVKYLPSECRYKVYIIDEVHMLSQGAFNALLKTLEEPPSHVIFILATTEPHKIPATILSRCQRFDFQSLDKADIVERLQYVLNAENIKATPEAVDLIAESSEGGMRDALSLLDPKLMKNNLAFANWKNSVDEVKNQTHYTEADFVFPGTAFGCWVPRSVNAHLQIYAGIMATELKNQGPVSVCAVLNDEKNQRTDKYENEWNGLWHFSNIMQFSDLYVAVSSEGLQNMDYLILPIPTSDDSISDTVKEETTDGWSELMRLEMAQLFEEETLAFIYMAKDAKIPAPTEDGIGYEVEGDDGEVVATVEIAWPDRKIGYLTTDQLEDKEILEDSGWKILSITDLADEVNFFEGGDN